MVGPYLGARLPLRVAQNECRKCSFLSQADTRNLLVSHMKETFEGSVAQTLRGGGAGSHRCLAQDLFEGPKKWEVGW